jgi:tRNA (mo5U34)-methyltransferase
MGAAAEADELGRQIAGLAPWFHNLHLPSGHQTAADHPLGDFPAFKWRQIAAHVPARLDGKRALDIGCNAGFYSFQLAARGAEVLAIDTDERYLKQARWAASWLDPERRVEFQRMTVYDLARTGDAFDLILFLGVLYHLRHPLLAIDAVAERLRGRLIFQTLTMPGAPPQPTPADVSIDERERLTAAGWPRAAFIEHRLAGDPTNWWAPDDACVRAMLRSAGLRITATPGHELYVCEPDTSADHDRRARRDELRAASGARAAGPAGESVQGILVPPVQTGRPA